MLERLRTLLPAELPLRSALGELLDGSPTLIFRPYDWGSNDVA